MVQAEPERATRTSPMATQRPRREWEPWPPARRSSRFTRGNLAGRAGEIESRRARTPRLVAAHVARLIRDASDASVASAPQLSADPEGGREPGHEEGEDGEDACGVRHPARPTVARRWEAEAPGGVGVAASRGARPGRRGGRRRRPLCLGPGGLLACLTGGGGTRGCRAAGGAAAPRRGRRGAGGRPGTNGAGGVEAPGTAGPAGRALVGRGERLGDRPAP